MLLPPCKAANAKYCSLRCSGYAKRGKNKDNTSIEFAAVRRNMWEQGLIRYCQRCGFHMHPEILEVHHMDRDRANNTQQNLEVLCPNCHAIEHKSEKRKEAGWRLLTSARFGAYADSVP